MWYRTDSADLQRWRKNAASVITNANARDADEGLDSDTSPQPVAASVSSVKTQPAAAQIHAAPSYDMSDNVLRERNGTIARSATPLAA